MIYRAAILQDRWQPVDLCPGSHVIVLSQREDVVLAARVAGFNVRDTMLILGPRSTRLAFLLRKPFEAPTVTEQVLRTRTGGLNINASRVCSDAKSGRWPSNVVFVHASTCTRAGTRNIKTSSGSVSGHEANRTGAAYGEYKRVPFTSYGESGSETVAAWNCDESCPVRILDEQSGQRPSTLTGRADPSKAHENPGDNGGASLFGGGNSKVYADSGGASRFFPQFSNDDELLRWFVGLIAAQGELVFFA